MASVGYASITGAKQGNITQNDNTANSMGAGFQSTYQNLATIQAYTMGIFVPTDPQSGQPTGLRVYQPATLTKVFDQSSPLLWQALCTGEQLTIELDLYRTAASGGQEKYFTYTWSGAILVDGKGYMLDCWNPNNGPYPDLETWSFTFSQIQWENVIAGTSGSDSWGSPTAGS
jgi:type VI secretion system secreted protein Hcp